MQGKLPPTAYKRGTTLAAGIRGLCAFKMVIMNTATKGTYAFTINRDGAAALAASSLAAASVAYLF